MGHRGPCCVKAAEAHPHRRTALFECLIYVCCPHFLYRDTTSVLGMALSECAQF